MTFVLPQVLEPQIDPDELAKLDAEIIEAVRTLRAASIIDRMWKRDALYALIDRRDAITVASKPRPLKPDEIL